MPTTIKCDFDPKDYATVSRDEAGVDLTIHEKSSDQTSCIYLTPETAADLIAAIRTEAGLPEVIEIPVSSLPEVTASGSALPHTLPAELRGAAPGTAAWAYIDALAALAKHRHRVAEEAKAAEDTQAARRDALAVEVAREAGWAGPESFTYVALPAAGRAAVRLLLKAEEAAK